MAAVITSSPCVSAKIEISDVLGLPSELLVSGVALDSRAVEPGYAFVALQGDISHGLAFMAQAKSNGASVILIDESDSAVDSYLREISTTIPVLAVVSLREKLGELARVVFGNVDEELALVGVTGTDGKTSITHFVAQLLSLSEGSGAVLGTVGNGFLEDLQVSTHTTGDVFQIFHQLASLKQQGAKSVAMEVSSHALHQDRVAGLVFDVAVLSNLGSDHLDYHGDLEHYAAAKARLFDQRAKRCVINIDDVFGRKLLALRPGAATYSASGDVAARWVASNCKYDADGIRCEISVSGMSQKVHLPVLGAFNVSNILAACATAEVLGESAESLLGSLPKLKPVTGRAELLLSSKGSRVVIDYAHTAQALEAVLNTLRDHFSSRIWCVFGCGGDRDRSKRAEMARAAESVADCLVVTSDNPRSEEPRRIIDDVISGLSDDARVHVEVDRARAIAYALASASSDDCILIAGKGHEDYQVLADRTIEFSDRAEVMAWQEGLA